MDKWAFFLKTKSRPEIIYGREGEGGGNSIYHGIITEDPRDALVAIFRRSNNPLTHLLGRMHIAATQGPVSLYVSLTHDFGNTRKYLKYK